MTAKQNDLIKKMVANGVDIHAAVMVIQAIKGAIASEAFKAAHGTEGQRALEGLIESEQEGATV